MFSLLPAFVLKCSIKTRKYIIALLNDLQNPLEYLLCKYVYLGAVLLLSLDGYMQKLKIPLDTKHHVLSVQSPTHRC